MAFGRLVDQKKLILQQSVCSSPWAKAQFIVVEQEMVRRVPSSLVQ